MLDVEFVEMFVRHAISGTSVMWIICTRKKDFGSMRRSIEKHAYTVSNVAL